MENRSAMFDIGTSDCYFSKKEVSYKNGEVNLRKVVKRLDEIGAVLDKRKSMLRTFRY
jgi:hypothetical protein